jgi:hypothetical protein
MTQVVLVSGHRVDAADRSVPRFPQSRVPWVADQVHGAFDDWHVGPDTTVITGGARGADIIAAEQATTRGARVLLCLALPPDEFERKSVDLAGTDWHDRFRRLLHVGDVRVLDNVADQSGETVFARANAWMVRLARQLDPWPRAVIVWDGKPGDGPGGTADLIDKLGYEPDDPRIRIIDPTPTRPSDDPG